MDEKQKNLLLAKQEQATYLDGLADALSMTKPQIKKAIKMIVEG